MKDYSGTNSEIRDSILNEYIEDVSQNDSDKIFNSVNLLIDNNLGCCIKETSDVYYGDPFYYVACKFVTKHNNDLKVYRRKLRPYEFGGSENRNASTNPELIKLTKYSLEDGSYFAQIDESNYVAIKITCDGDDKYMKMTEIIIIGDKWRKYKSKLFKMYDKYVKITRDSTSFDRIFGDKGVAKVIFKPFDQVIFSGKEDILKYIDNWVNAIPTYYNKYNMVAKLSIMLYGKPGTGKSTFAAALAKYLGIRNINALSPRYFDVDMHKEKRALRQFPNGVIYKIDDIDCVCKSRELENNKENNAQLSNLLTFLDNPPTFEFKAKDGYRYPVSIIVASTNYYDKLDDAVKRFGRFDKKIEMNYFKRKEAQEMCDIYGLKLEDIVENSDKKDFSISPSELQAICLENVDTALKNVENK